VSGIRRGWEDEMANPSDIKKTYDKAVEDLKEISACTQGERNNLDDYESYVEIIPRIADVLYLAKKHAAEDLFPIIGVAIKNIKGCIHSSESQKDLIISERIVSNCEETMRIKGNIWLSLTTGRDYSPSVFVILGFFANWIVSAVLIGMHELSKWGYKHIFCEQLNRDGFEIMVGIFSDALFFVGIFGGLGSVVSIMVRLQEFENLHRVKKPVLFYTGLFKPTVGALFAIALYSMYKANVLVYPGKFGPNEIWFFFLFSSFFAGFSERFATDIAKKYEDNVSNKNSLT
jgi:hypothetical protein